MNPHRPSNQRRSNTGSHKPSERESTAGPKSGSGRPTFDSRGNASWEWQTEEEGKFSADVDTVRLRKLEAPELSLEDTAKMKKLNLDEWRASGKNGFDPYDRGVLTHRGSAVGASEIKTKELKPKEPGAKASKKPIKDLRKYEEWLTTKKRLANKNEDD